MISVPNIHVDPKVARLLQLNHDRTPTQKSRTLEWRSPLPKFPSSWDGIPLPVEASEAWISRDAAATKEIRTSLYGQERRLDEW